jgi:hypothetical protein
MKTDFGVTDCHYLEGQGDGCSLKRLAKYHQYKSGTYFPDNLNNSEAESFRTRTFVFPSACNLQYVHGIRSIRQWIQTCVYIYIV